LTPDLIDDAAWALIAPFLRPERGRACRPSLDNRRVLEGIVWIARTGAPWRDLPERFGTWNTVWRRFARWRDARVFEGSLEALMASGAGDGAVQMIDSTVIPLPGSACLHAREGAH
jgi:transposase